MADYPIVPTVATGDTWTAAQHNTNLRDGIASLRPAIMLPIAAAIPPLSGVAAGAIELVESTGAGTAKPVIYQMRLDAATDEGRMWNGVAGTDLSSAPDLKIHYRMASANTSKNVVIVAQLAAVSDADATVNGKVFDSANSETVAVPDAANTQDVATITLTNADSIVAGDWFCLVLYRDADAVADDAAGDMIVTGVYLQNGA